MEIICVGKELLIGKTLNTNATWLAKSITSLGLKVRRMTVIDDDLDEIAETLREALRRKPRFIITTGGLGPTFDDKTLEGIAKGLNRSLEVNKKALKMVKEKYKVYLKQKRIQKVELTPARLKMARFPKGAEPLPNPVGTAPGMMAKIKETLIIALPGVPPEMEAIFNHSVAEIIRKQAGKSTFYEASTYAEGIMESTLAPLIESVMNENPSVYLKSHVYVKSKVQIEGQKSCIELHFSTTANDVETAKKHLHRAIKRMTELVQSSGGKIVRAPGEK